MAETKTLIVERVFDASPERVWQSWATPEGIMKWWGPQYFTSPECKMDFRVGGRYIFCMLAPEDERMGEMSGKRFYSTGIYKEIVDGEKIVYTDSLSDADGNAMSGEAYGMSPDFPSEMLVTVTFEGLDGGKTKLTIKHKGLPAGDTADMTEAGWNTSLDKLVESLK